MLEKDKHKIPWAIQILAQKQVCSKGCDLSKCSSGCGNRVPSLFDIHRAHKILI